MNAGESILAVHSGALGDVILFGHLLRHVGGRVTLVAGGAKGRLLEGLAVAGKAMDFDGLPMHEIFLDAAEAARPGSLANMLGRYDRLISCFAAGNPAAEAGLTAACGASSAAFLPVRPPEDFPGHLLEFWAQQMHLPPVSLAPAPWCVPAEWRERAAAELAAAGAAGGRYAVMHPGAGAARKCWPVERFVELAGLLKRDSDLAVVWVLGPVERERWGRETLERLAAAGVVLPPVDLETLAGVLAGAVAFAGNDSGPAHLAAAVGAATAVVAAQASVRQFAPLGRAVLTAAAPDPADVPAAPVAAALASVVS